MTTTPPRTTPQDPHFHARQDAQHFGRTITVSHARAMYRLWRASYSRSRWGAAIDPIYVGKRGTTTAKHYREGYRDHASSSAAQILETLYDAAEYHDAPWWDLLERWSRSGAEEQTITRLRNLVQAADLGLWSDGEAVPDFAPEGR